jgi:hypothetical protein
VLGVDELPKYYQLVVHVEDPEMTVKESLVLLDRQNEGLDTNDWVIARSRESRVATSSRFAALIGDGWLEVLKAFGFKPYFRLSRETIRLTGKKCK